MQTFHIIIAILEVPAVLIGGTRLIQIRAMHNKMKRMGYKKVKKIEKLSFSERFLYSFKKLDDIEIYQIVEKLLIALATVFPVLNWFSLIVSLVISKDIINDTIEERILNGTLVKIEELPAKIKHDNTLIDSQEKEQPLTREEIMAFLKEEIPKIIPAEEKINFDFSDIKKEPAPVQMTTDERIKELRKELETLEAAKEQELETIKQNKKRKGPYTRL